MVDLYDRFAEIGPIALAESGRYRLLHRLQGGVGAPHFLGGPGSGDELHVGAFRLASKTDDRLGEPLHRLHGETVDRKIDERAGDRRDDQRNDQQRAREPDQPRLERRFRDDHLHLGVRRHLGRQHDAEETALGANDC